MHRSADVVCVRTLERRPTAPETALPATLETFFCAAKDFRGDCPSVRLPAIRELIALARNASPPIRSRAATILVNEFGPHTVSHGIPGCAAPMPQVVTCSVEARDCNDCPWVWLPLEEETVAVARAWDPSQWPLG